MNVKVVKDITNAAAITHGGIFHADEVLSTAILAHIIPNMSVARVFRVPDNLDPNTIVYDVGGGKYDHHQRGGNGERSNGVPYASAGLIWQEFGFQVCLDTVDPQMVWKYVDRYLIQAIDANDNGAMPILKYPAQPMAVAQVVSGFNPTWDTDTTTPDADGLTAVDHAFLRAVEFVDVILQNTITYANSKAMAAAEVQAAIKKSKDGVLILDKYMPWKDVLYRSDSEQANAVKVVVYPEQRNGYAWCVVPNRALAPKAWCGLNNTELQQVSGCQSATFVHAGGFMGGARLLEDAAAMAKQIAAMAGE